MAEELTTYVCTACNAGHNDPRKISTCRSCGGVNTVKVRPVFMTDAKKKEAHCDVCGGAHPTRDASGQECGNLPGGGIFNAPSDLQQKCA